MVNGETRKNVSSSAKLYWNITKDEIEISDIPIKKIEEMKNFILLFNKENLQKMIDVKRQEKVKIESSLNLIILNLDYEIDGIKHIKNGEEVFQGEIIFKNLKVLDNEKFKSYEIIDVIREFSKDTFIKINKVENSVTLFGSFVETLTKGEENRLDLSLDKFISYIRNNGAIIESVENGFTEEKIKVDIETVELNGEIYYIELELKENREGLIGIFRDNTKEVVSSNNMKKLLVYDKVTGFRNKEELVTLIENKLKEERSQGAFILIDLDNFKFINESFSYKIGDAILKSVGERLVAILKCSEYVCRYNGDEFIVFLSNVRTKEDLEKILDKIMKIFYKSILVDNEQIYVNTSIGVAMYPQNGMDFYTLLKNSDAALSRAKENGKGNYVFFDSRLSKEFSRSYNIQKCLRDAIENKELYVLFQPKVFLDGTIVKGFEALIRWESRELGNVSPGEMIPIAEMTRLILPISTFVLEEVFKKIRELIDLNHTDFKIAVNLSELQLRYDTILPDLNYLQKKYNVDLKYLEIEITESILMKSFEKNIETLKKIKSLGATIALDDFGTGYSSLNYLTKLPIDVLKIDRSFIIDLIGNLKSRCIVENIINLSHELGIEVVAEGVEEEMQVDYLKSIFCDTIQGYYFSKPKPFDEIVNMIGQEMLV